jgi:hypothetical protein
MWWQRGLQLKARHTIHEITLSRTNQIRVVSCGLVDCRLKLCGKNKNLQILTQSIRR